MIVRRLVGVTAAAALLLGVGVSTGSTQAKKPDRVTVCHNGDDGIEAITVAERAVPALLANGGGLPGDPAGEGFVYGQDCSLEPVVAPAFCWAPIVGEAFVDLQLVGPINTLSNIAFFTSRDGSCTGNPASNATMVSATSEGEAVAECNRLGVPPFVGDWASLFWVAAPADYWVC